MLLASWQAHALACIVGIVWGICNGINKHCSTPTHHHRLDSQASSPAPPHTFATQLLSNPLFYAAQALNALASASFIWLTGQRACHLAVAIPCANGTSLAVTALADVLLTRTHLPNMRLAVPGLALTVTGITLCALG